MSTTIGFEIFLDASYDQSVNIVTEALKSEGFGVLTSIDVRSTFRNKLGEDFRPYVIIGACNPPLAHKAFTSKVFAQLGHTWKDSDYCPYVAVSEIGRAHV